MNKIIFFHVNGNMNACMWNISRDWKHKRKNYSASLFRLRENKLNLSHINEKQNPRQLPQVLHNGVARSIRFFPIPKRKMFENLKNFVPNFKLLLLFKMRTSNFINMHRGEHIISLTALNLSFVPSLCFGSTEHLIVVEKCGWIEQCKKSC